VDPILTEGAQTLDQVFSNKTRVIYFSPDLGSNRLTHSQSPLLHILK
jgi:hypothetical protein